MPTATTRCITCGHLNAAGAKRCTRCNDTLKYMKRDDDQLNGPFLAEERTYEDDEDIVNSTIIDDDSPIEPGSDTDFEFGASDDF